MLESLPIPDEFESVMTPENRLPLEYLPAHWLVIICTEPSRNEYGFTSGGDLHRNWESARHHRFRADARNTPNGAIQVHCPDGTFLAVKITSYCDTPPHRTARRSNTTR